MQVNTFVYTFSLLDLLVYRTEGGWRKVRRKTMAPPGQSEANEGRVEGSATSNPTKASSGTDTT